MVVAGFGAVAIAMVARTAAEEAARLGDEVRRLGDLQPAVVAIRQEAARTADAVDRLRHR